MYTDKESFVTSAYRAKMEVMQKAEEEEKRRDMLEGEQNWIDMHLTYRALMVRGLHCFQAPLYLA